MASYDNSIGTTKNFEIGTKVFNNYKTLYDKDDMYIITNKHGPIERNIQIEMGINIVEKYYKYDLKKIDDEKKLEKQSSVYPVTTVTLDGYIGDNHIKGNIEDIKIKNRTIKKIEKDEGDYSSEVPYTPEFPDRHFITLDNSTIDDDKVTFTGEVIKEKQKKNGGKRKTRHNRKSKKGKRSRKARKSRRKSNRRRGRR